MFARYFREPIQPNAYFSKRRESKIARSARVRSLAGLGLVEDHALATAERAGKADAAGERRAAAALRCLVFDPALDAAAAAGVWAVTDHTQAQRALGDAGVGP